jgi:hypothetical protein
MQSFAVISQNMFLGSAVENDLPVLSAACDAYAFAASSYGHERGYLGYGHGRSGAAG